MYNVLTQRAAIVWQKDDTIYNKVEAQQIKSVIFFCPTCCAGRFVVIRVYKPCQSTQLPEHSGI